MFIDIPVSFPYTLTRIRTYL